MSDNGDEGDSGWTARACRPCLFGTHGDTAALYQEPPGGRGRDGALFPTVEPSDVAQSQCDAAAVPSMEVCDGLDDDCDGVIDEGVAELNACGGCGVSGPELCDGRDNNCNGSVDELSGSIEFTAGLEVSALCAACVENQLGRCDACPSKILVTHTGPAAGLMAIDMGTHTTDRQTIRRTVNIAPLNRAGPAGSFFFDEDPRYPSELVYLYHEGGDFYGLVTTARRADSVYEPEKSVVRRFRWDDSLNEPAQLVSTLSFPFPILAATDDVDSVLFVLRDATAQYPLIALEIPKETLTDLPASVSVSLDYGGGIGDK